MTAGETVNRGSAPRPTAGWFNNPSSSSWLVRWAPRLAIGSRCRSGLRCLHSSECNPRNTILSRTDARRNPALHKDCSSSIFLARQKFPPTFWFCSNKNFRRKDFHKRNFFVLVCRSVESIFGFVHASSWTLLLCWQLERLCTADQVYTRASPATARKKT